MTTSADLSTLRARFVGAWATASGSTPVIYDNAPATDVDEAQPWVRFGINPSTTSRETLGTSAARFREGMVWLQVFLPNNVGVKRAYELTDAFTGIFKDWRATGTDLWCGNVSIRQVPNSDRFQVIAMVPYEARS